MSGAVTAIAELAGDVIGRLWPDKSEAERQQMAAALTIVQGQLAANAAEARSASALMSGWRPGIGWVCAGALCLQYIARPLVAWVGVISGHAWPPLPGIDDALWELMLGMLGLGGLRTVEKLRGVHS